MGLSALIPVPQSLDIQVLMLPETFPSNWRFGMGLFDKSSLISGMSLQAPSVLCVASSHRGPLFMVANVPMSFFMAKRRLCVSLDVLLF